MQIFESYKKDVHGLEGCVVVIGNFDGVHKGHQVLLKTAQDIAHESGVPLAVLTFEPHPRTLFRPEDPVKRLTPPDVKAWRMKEFGVDVLFSIPFDWDFASQSAESFIQDILIDGLNVSHVVVGYDFRFGQMRKGDPAMIEAAGLALNVVAEQDYKDGVKYSSSDARQALRHGHLREANDILGWDWEIWGEVIKGDQRGRELGYPTANFDMGDTVHPSYGVYATMVNIQGEDAWYASATNIGIRPMFEVPTAQVESFIFDFDREIYGEVLRVRLVQRLRGEAKFDSLDALIKQMDEDCVQARKILQS